jgi:hypothetical protein
MARPHDPVETIHLKIEALLDDFRRKGTSEEIVTAALMRTVRASDAMTMASRAMSPVEQHRR